MKSIKDKAKVVAPLVMIFFDMNVGKQTNDLKILMFLVGTESKNPGPP